METKYTDSKHFTGKNKLCFILKSVTPNAEDEITYLECIINAIGKNTNVFTEREFSNELKVFNYGEKKILKLLSSLPINNYNYSVNKIVE